MGGGRLGTKQRWLRMSFTAVPVMALWGTLPVLLLPSNGNGVWGGKEEGFPGTVAIAASAELGVCVKDIVQWDW